MKSILQEDTDYCFVCGRYGTEIHHIFFGTANRKLSDKYGLVVGLCYNHHRGRLGVHNGNRELDLMLKQIGQTRFNNVYPDEEFLAVFGKNFLNE
jgi:hypothetical protein